MNKYKIDFSNPKKKFSYCKANTKCSVEHCNNPVFCKGYCTKHYAQIQHHGKIIDTMYDKNEIIKYDDYAEIIVRNKQGDIKGKALIDLDDVDKCKRLKWGMYANGYFYGNINKTLRVRLHRFILGLNAWNKDNEVDHINRNRADNRKSNLRVVNHSINNINKDKINPASSTVYKYKHIIYSRKYKSYTGRFYYNSKSYSVGYYNTELAAHIAVEKLRKEVMGNNYIE